MDLELSKKGQDKLGTKVRMKKPHIERSHVDPKYFPFHRRFQPQLLRFAHSKGGNPVVTHSDDLPFASWLQGLQWSKLCPPATPDRMAMVGPVKGR